jgi:ATP-dependent protease HslVU (ClpYQ) peptidase subunit
MTCIVGLVDKGKVFIGGDSAGVRGSDMHVRRDKKVFVNDGFAIGFTTSFRMGQLLAYSFNPPQADPKADPMRFMVNDFIGAVRECFKNGGFASRNNEVESGGEFLVGYRGRLFCINGDYQVAEMASGFHAVGCGESFAIGALHATPKGDPRKRVLYALGIAEECSAGVRGPFHVVSV